MFICNEGGAQVLCTSSYLPVSNIYCPFVGATEVLSEGTSVCTYIFTKLVSNSYQSHYCLQWWRNPGNQWGFTSVGNCYHQMLVEPKEFLNNLYCFLLNVQTSDYFKQEQFLS
jgi:hypothetical protein